jgi:aryl-alcohol dehydrogenase-like predicted oxidoreductase
MAQQQGYPKMKRVTLGAIGEVSHLTLGGGGLGGVWGPTSREEAIATIRAAVDAGIDLIDAAPGYRAYESIIGEAFGGRPPPHVRFTSKHGPGSPAAHEIYPRLRASIEASLSTMKLERLDVFFLHNEICPDDYVYPADNDRRESFATTWSLYRDHVAPALQRLRQEGLLGAWGITAVGVPDTIVEALQHDPRPQAAQVVANLLDSVGSLRRFAGPARPRHIIEVARQNGAGVLGMRAVQAGALTRAIDRDVAPDNADARDYHRAAPFRALCEAWGEDPAVIAHRYTLAMDGIDTLILGVKNRRELDQVLAAEATGPLEPDRIAEVDGLGLRE